MRHRVHMPAKRRFMHRRFGHPGLRVGLQLSHGLTSAAPKLLKHQQWGAVHVHTWMLLLPAVPDVCPHMRNVSSVPAADNVTASATHSTIPAVPGGGATSTAVFASPSSAAYELIRKLYGFPKARAHVTRSSKLL